MLSAAKIKQHGMQDENWVIRDKINQYRGLIKLYERDRKIHEGDLVKQKRRYSRDIKQLRRNIVLKREELSVVAYGDKQFLRNAFQEHRRLQLMYMNSQADQVLDSIHQENFNRRKKLDRIAYTKKKKMEKFRQQQLELAELRDRLIYEKAGKLPAEQKEQAVANYVQKANIKKNAALAIKVMYKKILDILKKDSSYFGVVLDALKLDCRAQGKCLMGATEMGQLAMEYLDDRKFEFNKLEQEIKANMKERERTLKLVRREVEYLTNSFPNLLRKEEVSNLDDLYEQEDAVSQHSIHWELEEVMSICRKLQKSTLVSSFDQILPRLHEQQYQKGRLMSQLSLNSMKRDGLMEDRKHALLMLTTLKNIGQEETAAGIRQRYLIRKTVDPMDIPDTEFKKRYRLSKQAVRFLAEELRSKTNLRASKRVSLEHKLLCALSFYATGSYQRLVGMGKHLGQSTVSNYVREVTEALNNPRITSTHIKFPTLRGERDLIKQKYVAKKKGLRESLEAEQREQDHLIKSLDDKGKLIIFMKTSIQQVHQLLSSVEAPNIQRPETRVPPAVQYVLDDMIQPVPELEADLDKLIMEARQKLSVLMGAIKEAPTPDTKHAANLFYHNIIARSMRENYKEAAVAEAGLIEFETEDPNVPNHALIKLRSKQLVEAQVSEFDVPDNPPRKY